MMGYWGRGPGYDGYHGRGYANVTTEQRSRLDELDRKFTSETANLRNEIRGKSVELDALLNSPNPDIGKARALQKKINDLRAELDQKATNYEIEARKVAPDVHYGRGRHMMGYGPGAGYGRHMGGYGPGSCWN
jgi:zinc resistance-associated protein